MYAIVNIAGQQFKVEKDHKIFVHRLNAEIGNTVDFPQVLFIENEGKTTIGKPYIENASVSVKVLEHIKADKLLVFKKKRRKGYQKLNGHRQQLTKVEIENISLDGKSTTKKATANKTTTKTKETETKTTKAEETKSE